MSRQFFLTPIMLLLLTSCGHFYTQRSYLAQMEHDDSRFFNPWEDFPVIAGDTGRYWNTEADFRARTPASEEEMTDDLLEQNLRQELTQLEGQQLDEDMDLYLQHRHQFQNVSERIYFLKLPSHERMDYLTDRGFIARSNPTFFSKKQRDLAVRSQDILMGMKKEDVLESWGKPLKVEVAGNPKNENERWLYHYNGTPKYIYFESGEVRGWE